jgi:GMP synthase (glutamine-hydrolysing)
MYKLLLIQARHPDDPMMGHEVECIRDRLGSRPFNLSVRNSFTDVASTDWLDSMHGVLIGGSGEFSVHHPKSQRWVDPLRRVFEKALSADIFGLGICFGHQLLGRHMGGEVRTDADRAEMGTVEVSLTDAGSESALFRKVGSPFDVHTGHSDSVVVTPTGVRLLATNSSLETQAFHVVGSHFYSVQFHPDMTGAQARSRYLAYGKVFAEKNRVDVQREAEKFLLDRDESCEIIGNWADMILEESA